MLAGVIAWAYYTVLAKRLAGADQVLVIAWVSLIGMAMLLPFAAVELLRGSVPRFTAEGWLGVLFLVFGLVVYHSLDYYLKRALRDALEMRTRQVARLFFAKPCADGDIEHVIRRIREHF